MAKRRPLEERLAETQERVSQLQEQEKKLEKQYKEQMRKQRNHRLIEVGAIMESIYKGPIEHKKQDLLAIRLRTLEEEEGFLTKLLSEEGQDEKPTW